jgi:hypothetical protein
MDRLFKITKSKQKSSSIFTFGIEDDKKTVKKLVKKFNGTLYEPRPVSVNSSGTRPKTREMYNNLCLSKTVSPCR